MERTVHELKIWPDFFPAVESGDKPFEIRKNDRDFKKGDIVHLREFLPMQKSYTGRELWSQITYITDFGQPEGQVVFGISRPVTARHFV